MITYEALKMELPVMLEIVEKAPESVRHKVLDLLVASFLGPVAANPGAVESEPPASSAQGQAGVTKNRKKKAGSESYQIDKELSLRGVGQHGSFREFCDSKLPTSAGEFNAVAVYYLANAVGIKESTFNQLYTCYKDVGRRTPEFFKQSVIDTKNKQGWIDLTEDGRVVITHRGTEFVEHDLPKKKPTKSDRKQR